MKDKKSLLDALKHQGKRSDIEDNTTSVENQQKLKASRELLVNQSGESEDKIRRYIRLTYYNYIWFWK